jgi:hypothetical protein
MGCRSCGGDDLRIILDLGSQLIANALLREEGLRQPVAKFTLAGSGILSACALLQVTETVPADVLNRRDYPCFSSSSPALLEHSAEHVQALACRHELGPSVSWLRLPVMTDTCCATSSTAGLTARW